MVSSSYPGLVTKALIEASRAQFHIKTSAHSGTLIEVVLFARA
jgi:hypothetical protein